MSSFADALRASSNAKVVYNDSHDDCGNRQGSARTIILAVNGAPLIGDTRRWAEARARFAAGMTLLSAGTPMFFMGEEVGAQRPYRYDDFAAHRENILADADGEGARLFAYYQALVRLSVGNHAIRSRSIDVALADDDDRVIAFHRWDGSDDFFVVGCLSNAPFIGGYLIRSPRFGNAGWTEVFNSDAAAYGGWNVGNEGRTLRAEGGVLNPVLPAAGLVVFRRH